MDPPGTISSRSSRDTPPERLLDACLSRNLGGPPVWIMRQAGRYLPGYSDLRKKHSFVDLCTEPDLAVQVSLEPFQRFGFDAVIVFYDILFIAEAMGAPLEFTDDGPVFRQPVRSESDVEALHAPDLRESRLRGGTGAILETLTRLRAAVPRGTAVLGFAGGPFTVAAYLIEGGFKKGGDGIRRALHESPAAVHRLLAKLAEATGEYLRLQVEAGATAVQLFDTWAGILDAATYRAFALPYEKQAFERLAPTGAPGILYVNGCSHILEDVAHSGARVLSVDWREPLSRARQRLGTGLALQGNLDPAALFAPVEEVRRRALATLESLRGDPGYIFNLGHGILPETPLRSVEALVETVRGAT